MLCFIVPQADPTPSKPTTASVSAQVPAADGFISSAAAPSSTVLVEDFRALKEHVSQLDARLTTVEAAQPVQEVCVQLKQITGFPMMASAQQDGHLGWQFWLMAMPCGLKQ